MSLQPQQFSKHSSAVLKNPHQCKDCGMKFTSASELLNHAKKFCINSGFDSLDGLALYDIKKKFNTDHKKDKGKVKQIYNTNQKNNGFRGYGQSSLGNINYEPAQNYNDIYGNNANALANDVISLRRQNEANNLKKPYKFNQNNSKADLKGYQQSQVNQFQPPNMENYALSRWQKFDVKQYQDPYQKQTYISPPTMTKQMKELNSVLHKSNESLKNMHPSKKKGYAILKLQELQKIKSMYEQNGGTSKQFKKNIAKMIQFYQKMIQEIQQSGSRFQPTNSQHSLSRISTPILKLRQYTHNRIPNSDPNKDNQQIKQKNLQQEKQFNSQISIQNSLKNRGQKQQSYPKMYNQGNFNPYGQNTMLSNQNPQIPQIIMLPPYPQPQTQQTSTFERQNLMRKQNQDNMKILQKMMQLKSEQNKKLINLLVQSKREKNQITSDKFVNTKSSQFSGLKKFDYNFQRSVVEGLTTEQRMLLALQQEQLDQLKLLSSLPQQLQQIKMQSVAKMAETRFQMQKAILQQRMEKMQNQQQIQYFQQQRKLMNDKWVSQQRKKLIEKKMNALVDSYQNPRLVQDQDDVEEYPY